MSAPFNEDFRFGSAQWATRREIRKAGLFGPNGLPIGFWKRRPLRSDSDASLITIGGAGSGKFRDVLAFAACNSPGENHVWLDPRGEISEVSEPSHVMNGDDAYRFNPLRLFGAGSHKINPLELLTKNSPTLLSDCKIVAEALVALKGGEKDNYFDLRARDWIEKILFSLVQKNRRVTLADLHQVVAMIEGDTNAWAEHIKLMQAIPVISVRRVAGEMLSKQLDSPREFGSVMGSIYAALGFLDDTVLLDELNESELSLYDFLGKNRGKKLFLNIPAEFLSAWSPLIRLIFSVVMILKGRAPEAPRMTLIVDEAGQLGRFDALLRAFTFGRGAGIRAWAVFQDTGQIIRNYGRAALASFLGSAQTRQFFGVRDWETAKLISDMLGTETLEYDDERSQAEARKRKRDAMHRMFAEDADPFEAAREYTHYADAEVHRSKQSRPLMTPEEIMNMPEDRQILFISGKDLNPIKAWKYPYFTRREMAGKYLPNPHHPPTDKVKVRGLLWSRWVDVITEPVPEELASFAQYRDGTWRYLDGFKP